MELITFLAPRGTREAMKAMREEYGIEDYRYFVLGMFLVKRRSEIGDEIAAIEEENLPPTLPS